MTQKCDKENEMTEFIEKYSFGVKLYKVAEMKRRTKALSRDEYKIKTQ